MARSRPEDYGITPDMSLAERLKVLRGKIPHPDTGELPYPVAALAKKAQVSRVYFYEIERGERNPTLNKLEGIAAAFDVDIEVLVSKEAASPQQGALMRVYDDLSPEGQRRALDLARELWENERQLLAEDDGDQP